MIFLTDRHDSKVPHFAVFDEPDEMGTILTAHFEDLTISASFVVLDRLKRFYLRFWPRPFWALKNRDFR